MSPTIILVILLALASAGDLILAKLYVGAKADVAAETQKYDSFVADVKVMGEKAQTEAKAHIMSDKLAKDTADAEHKATVAALTSTIGKLRADADRARGSFVPAAAPGANRPDLACFDRPQLESAIGGFVKDLRGFADEGTAATLDINTARIWAAGLRR